MYFVIFLIRDQNKTLLFFCKILCSRDFFKIKIGRRGFENFNILSGQLARLFGTRSGLHIHEPESVTVCPKLYLSISRRLLSLHQALFIISLTCSHFTDRLFLNFQSTS